jgi:hypothetical protein
MKTFLFIGGNSDIAWKTKKKIELILNDVINLKVRVTPPKFFVNNAKDLINKNFKKFDGVITSPPYLNVQIILGIQN